ncbi:hypothetical protein ABZV58_22385 [Nocardia sp. NPDC004654]|uniref:hypothetical protein n=1 Tax=Nocardia sp. NPDC004654 TaxID=3154776 RepID=UPI0033A3C1CB
MKHVLLSVHVVAAIVFVGGSAVASSLFPRYAPVAAGAPTRNGAERSVPVAQAMHRVTGVYAALGVIVPVVGIVLAAVQGRMGEIWITLAMVLTAVAGGLLAVQIHPMQRDALAAPDDGRRLRVLGMLAGVYNLLWVVVVVLMIVRPGS